jgi:plasmid maintenance system killer protein
VDISFRVRSLQKACNSDKDSRKRWGEENSKKVRARLADLAAFACLADVPSTPPYRCHPLKGQRDGQFAIDVKHPFRLIFEVAHDPVPTLDDGSVDLRQVTAIRVIAVEDYHGE